MRGLSYLALMVCLGRHWPWSQSQSESSASPASSSSHSPKKLQGDPSKMFMKRDYQVPEPIPQDTYGVPPVQDSYAEPPADNGYYYYYYPLEEEHGGKVGKGGKDGCGGAEKLLAPLILITIFVGIMAANDIGLIPQLQLPPITIPAIGDLTLPTIQKPDLGLGNLGLPTIPKPDLGNLVLPNIGKPDLLNPAGIVDLINDLKPGKRDISGNASPYYDYIPWGAFEKLTTVVLDAIESDECSSRLMCETGRYAEGYGSFLSMMEVFTPEVYRNKMSIFKDAALKKSNCKAFKCTYVDDNSL